MKKNIFIWAVFILILIGCDYKGDGKLLSNGTWPFIDYKLNLPKEKLENKKIFLYNINGYKSHRHSKFVFYIRGDEGQFLNIIKNNLNQIELEIYCKQKNSKIVYSKTGSLETFNGVIEKNYWAFMNRFEIDGKLSEIKIQFKNIPEELLINDFEIILSSSWK